MKIYISNNDGLNYDILAFLQAFDENVEIIKREKFSFSAFLKKDMQKLKLYNEIIIDRSAVKESDADFTKLLEQFQLLYSTKIIIILKALDKTLIKSLINIGIVNIVIGEEKGEVISQLEECLSPNGINSIKWVRMFPDDNLPIEKSKTPYKAVIIFALCVALIGMGAILFAFKTQKTENKTSNSPALSTTPTTVTTSAPQTSSVATTTVVTTKPEPATVTTTTKKPTSESSSTTSEISTSTVKKTTTTTTKKATTTTKVTTTKAPETTTKKATTTTKKVTTAETTTTVYIRLTGLEIQQKGQENLLLGESVTLTPIFHPNRATNKKLTWISNRTDRIIVDQNGKCTAVGEGAAIITCVSDDGGLRASYMIVGVDGD